MSASVKPNITLDLLDKIDIRVGTIISVLAQPEKPVPNGTRVV